MRALNLIFVFNLPTKYSSTKLMIVLMIIILFSFTICGLCLSYFIPIFDSYMTPIIVLYGMICVMIITGTISLEPYNCSFVNLLVIDIFAKEFCIIFILTIISDWLFIINLLKILT